MSRSSVRFVALSEAKGPHVHPVGWARRGFTMLEAVVALAIIGLVCVSVLAAFGAAMRADVVAANRLPLAALATERLSAIDLSAGALDRLPDSLARGTFTAPYQTATWTAEARRVNQTEDLYDVAVSVHDGSDTFTLRTRRYRRTAAAVAVNQ